MSLEIRKDLHLWRDFDQGAAGEKGLPLSGSGASSAHFP